MVNGQMAKVLNCWLNWYYQFPIEILSQLTETDIFVQEEASIQFLFHFSNSIEDGNPPTR